MARHNTFFRVQQQFIPIIHSARYLRGYYSSPNLRPPMCLQYAIWAMASNGHPKYGTYHEVFYQRARQYLEADELRVSPLHCRLAVEFALLTVSARATASSSSPSPTPRPGVWWPPMRRVPCFSPARP